MRFAVIITASTSASGGALPMLWKWVATDIIFYRVRIGSAVHVYRDDAQEKDKYKSATLVMKSTRRSANSETTVFVCVDENGHQTLLCLPKSLTEFTAVQTLYHRILFPFQKPVICFW